MPFDQSVATNFDWHFLEYAYRHSAKEVKNWSKDSNVKITYFDENESGLSVSGKKFQKNNYLNAY